MAEFLVVCTLVLIVLMALWLVDGIVEFLLSILSVL